VLFLRLIRSSCHSAHTTTSHHARSVRQKVARRLGYECYNFMMKRLRKSEFMHLTRIFILGLPELLKFSALATFGCRN
jgi:hypothetical protein